MRRTEVETSWQISIRSQDGGRLCYWGIQYSGNDNMINFINSARGSHDIATLRYFEQWSVDDWKPDLILYACNTINEMKSQAGGTLRPIRRLLLREGLALLSMGFVPNRILLRFLPTCCSSTDGNNR